MRIHRHAAILAAALALICLRASGQTIPGPEVGHFPTAAPLSGTERILADQNQNTVNITPVQLANFIGLPAGLSLPVSIVNGGTGANNAPQGIINLLPSLVANDCLASNSSATVVIWQACGGAGSTFQANGTNLSSSSTINFLNGTATDGLTLLFSNPSAGNVQLGMSGTLTPAGGGTGLTSTPSNGQLLIGNSTGYTLSTLSAGSNVSITNTAGGITIGASVPTVPVFQTNGTGLSATSTINFENSAATNGLTLTFANPSAGNVQLGLTGFPALVSGECLSNNGSTLSWATCTPGGGGTVTGVTLSPPAPLSGGACTGSGGLTCAFSWTSGQTANWVLASPNGTTGPVSLRALVPADIPALGATPTGSVGLTAVPGSATTYMRSDAAPALSQAISPTMSGNWTFTASTANLRIAPGVTYAGDWALVDGQSGGHTYENMSGFCNGASAGTWSLYDFTTNASRVCINSAGAATFEAPSAGNTITANGLAGSYAMRAVGSSTSGQSNGVNIDAGTTAADSALYIANQAITAQLFVVQGDGGVQVGAPTGGDKGAGSLNAQSLYINGNPVTAPGGANPSATIGLTAVNGTASTFMRSDSAPALSQSISPNMTGNWTFTTSTGSQLKVATSTATWAEGWNLVDGQASGHTYGDIAGYCSGAAAGNWSLYDYTASASRACVNATGNWTFQAPSTGPTINVHSVSGSYGLQINSGNGATTNTPDIQITRNGSTANAVAEGPGIQFLDATGNTSTILQNAGGQSELWQFNASSWSQLALWNTSRQLVLNPAGTGSTLNVTESSGASAASSAAINVTGAVSASGDGSSVSFYPAANSAIRWGTAGDGYIDAPGSSANLHLRTAGNDNLDITYGGTVIINTPTGGNALTVNGLNGSYTTRDIGSSTAGQSFGAEIQAGTNASDEALKVTSFSNTPLLGVLGDGGVTVGSPTGGDLGAGKLNAQGLYVNGAAVLTSASVAKNAYGILRIINGSTSITFNGGGLSSLTYTGTGQATLNFVGGFFSNGAICTSGANSNNPLLIGTFNNASGIINSVVVTVQNTSTFAVSDGTVYVNCVGT
jgi:hypothetical protein